MPTAGVIAAAYRARGRTPPDWVGLRRWKAGPVLARPMLLPDDPPPGGVLLGSAPLAPRAKLALGPAAFEARIRWYKKRAARRLPLFARRDEFKEACRARQGAAAPTREGTR